MRADRSTDERGTRLVSTAARRDPPQGRSSLLAFALLCLAACGDAGEWSEPIRLTSKRACTVFERELERQRSAIDQGLVETRCKRLCWFCERPWGYQRRSISRSAARPRPGLRCAFVPLWRDTTCFARGDAHPECRQLELDAQECERTALLR